MFLSNSRITNGLKAIERLRPDIQSIRRRINPSNSRPTNQAVKSETTTVQPPSAAPLDGPPSLHRLIQEFGPFAPQTILLGLCEDGLPFLLDLTNSAPGSLLITADPGAGKTNLVKSILHSGILINTPSQTSFNIFAQDPGEFLYLAQSDHCQEMTAHRHSAVSGILSSLVETAERRQRGDPSGPAIILAIDGLASCLQSLDHDNFVLLYRLIKHGLRSRIWTIANLSTEEIAWMNPRVITAFRTQVFGRVISPRKVATLMDFDVPDRLPAGQFCVPYGNDWLNFWACDPT